MKDKEEKMVILNMLKPTFLLNVGVLKCKS